MPAAVAALPAAEQAKADEADKEANAKGEEASAANEELALLRASKQLLAARHELGADDVRAHPRVHDAVHVVQGQMEENVVILAPSPGLGEGFHLSAQVRVGQHHTLGLPGRARRIEPEAHIVAPCLGRFKCVRSAVHRRRKQLMAFSVNARDHYRLE